MRQLHELITVMRLFKAGGVGLGPYAFAPTGEGSWRRIATGAGAVRPGGYLLTKAEAESLAEFACALEVRPDPEGALAWAVDRFEMGCGRDSALEGLSDHLLALRSVLDGEGPVGASLPKRAAALIEDDPVARGVCHERIEAALELERSLMRGAPPAGTPELAGWVEEGVRGILRQAALGEISTDLGTAADESLIASGLAEGDPEITVSVTTPNPIIERAGMLRSRIDVASSPDDDRTDARVRALTTLGTQRRNTRWTTTPASWSRSRPRTRSGSPRPTGSTRSRSTRAARSNGRRRGATEGREPIDTPTRAPPLPGARGRRLAGPRARLRPLPS